MTPRCADISRILFVCTGNTCRSPLAEVYARQTYPEFKFSSAGLAAVVGLPASANSKALARDTGLDLTKHKATPTDDLDPADFDLVLAMTDSHARRLRASERDWNVDLLGKYSETSKEIADPYGGDKSQYRLAFREIQLGVDAWMKRLNSR